ncbi:MAG: orotate phosphoribosyltransferase [Syntrophomonadaceae bacterium]|nr:orotate phosphoribosyltransferase [Syntrophomonadaceae bacterium]
MTEDEALFMFKESQALLEGHFRLTSGRHSNQYMQCARVLQYPAYASRLGAELARRFREAEVQVVIGPAIGGIVLAQEVARALGGQVRSLFAERENGVMSLRRGFSLEPGERVLVVEDVITTGGSVQEVIELVKNLGGEVVGVGVLVDRSGGQVSFAVPKEAVLTMEIVSYPPEACPLCDQGLPVVKPGSRSI